MTEPIIVSTWNHGLAANKAAASIVQVGGDPMTAIVRGIMVTEADPKVTSVGRGGYPNIDGTMQLDAAVMDGNSLEVGAVAGMEDILYPVAVAQKVMSETRHTLLVGSGATQFALSQGFEKTNLLSEGAKKAWEAKKAGQKHAPAGSGADPAEDSDREENADPNEFGDPDNHDTIGTVILMPDGRMSAACSTSGAAWKLPGRVGDSPIAGHGLYCDAEIGGVVATGLGEEFAKVCGAFAVIERMRQGVEPEIAIKEVIERAVRRDPKNKRTLLAMVALRKDGKIGAASSTPGFQVAIARGTNHELVSIDPLYPRQKKD